MPTSLFVTVGGSCVLGDLDSSGFGTNKVYQKKLAGGGGGGTCPNWVRGSLFPLADLDWQVQIPGGKGSKFMEGLKFMGQG